MTKRQRAWPCDNLEEAVRKVAALGELEINCKLEVCERDPGLPAYAHIPYVVSIKPFALVNEEEDDA